MKNNRRHLNRNKNGFSAILETLIAVGISVTLLTIFFYSTATLYTVQDKPEADAAAKAVGVMETLIGSTGQDNSSNPGWEDQPLHIIPQVLGLGTSPTLEYGIICVNESTSETTIICRYGASQDAGAAEACFLAGTKIVMVDGTYKNIEDIKIGDIVKSYDTETDEISDCRVSHVYHHTPEEMTNHYLIINKQLRVTPNHHFYSDGRWIEAGELETGDSLFYQGSNYEISSIEKVFKKTYTYNFEVEDCHNYFVALEENDALVHNALTPKADAGGPYFGSPNNYVNFYGEPDSSPGGLCGAGTYISKYKWDFNNDGTYDYTETFPNNAPDGAFDGNVINWKTYGSPGDYTVKLTVEDNCGNTDDDTASVTISQAPVAKFSWFDQDGLGPGTTIFFNAEKTYGAPVINYTWDWNSDGNWDTGPLYTTFVSNTFLTGVVQTNVTLRAWSDYGLDTIKQTIYINSLNLYEPTPEPWVLTSKNIYPNDQDAAFLSYRAGYYVKYTNLTLPPHPPEGIYKRFEVKQKTSTSAPIIDIDKVTILGEYNNLGPQHYEAIRETLGLVTEQVSYNFNITITYTDGGNTANVYFGPSYQNIVGGVREEVTRQVYIYNPPHATAPPGQIDKPPYYLIGEITVHIFLGGQFGVP